MAYVSGFRQGMGVSAGVVASLLFTFLSLAASPARAQDDSASGVQVELGVFGGVHIFAHDLELGVADDPALPSPKSNGLFGARAALAFNRILSLEIEGVGIPTGDTIHNYRLFVVGSRAQVLAHIPVRILDGKLRPFVLAGVGALSVVDTVGTEYDEIKKDTDFEFHGGVGLKYAITPLIGLRIDGRVLGVPNTTHERLLAPTTRSWAASRSRSGATRRPRRRHRHRLCAVAVKDSDGDGIPDDVDKCPNAAEDKDGFEDTDGCPDPDNDNDGIPDSIDKCPNEAETKNGIDDDDGCPEKDEDGDGILGSNDKCPNEAEDKDGFEDDDGCPDLDNDKDGIPDATDKCPNEPETKNGYQDEDGCPDEVPAAIAKFTGVIKGISFRKGSAVINPSSFPTLEAGGQGAEGVSGAQDRDLRPHLRRRQARLQHEAVAAARGVGQGLPGAQRRRRRAHHHRRVRARQAARDRQRQGGAGQESPHRVPAAWPGRGARRAPPAPPRARAVRGSGRAFIAAHRSQGRRRARKISGAGEPQAVKHASGVGGSAAGAHRGRFGTL